MLDMLMEKTIVKSITRSLAKKSAKITNKMRLTVSNGVQLNTLPRRMRATVRAHFVALTTLWIKRRCWNLSNCKKALISATWISREIQLRPKLRKMRRLTLASYARNCSKEMLMYKWQRRKSVKIREDRSKAESRLARLVLIAQALLTTLWTTIHSIWMLAQ